MAAGTKLFFNDSEDDSECPEFIRMMDLIVLVLRSCYTPNSLDVNNSFINYLDLIGSSLFKVLYVHWLSPAPAPLLHSSRPYSELANQE